MFNHSSSRAVEQFLQLTQGGSSQYGPSAERDEPGPANFAPPPAKKWSLWNLDRLFQLIRKRGEEDILLAATQAENYREREQFKDTVRTQAAKYDTEMRRGEFDRQIEMRGLAFLQASGVRKCIDTCDAILVCTEYYDRKRAQLAQSIKEEKYLAKAQDELWIAYERAIVEVRASAFGLKYGAERFNGGEYDQ
jgi:hypothetical protein